MDTTRRSLLVGLGCIIAAPAIVRASSLMAIKPVKRYSPWSMGPAPTGDHVLLYEHSQTGTFWYFQNGGWKSLEGVPLSAVMPARGKEYIAKCETIHIEPPNGQILTAR